MRVLTYVDKILTVIKEDKMEKTENHPVPDFLKKYDLKESFYYEPNLFLLDDTPISEELEIYEELKTSAESFIDNYSFKEVEIPKEVEKKHLVDKDGFYIGYEINNGKYIEVEYPPEHTEQLFINNTWKHMALVNKESLQVMSESIDLARDNVENYILIDNDLVDRTFCTECQYYDKETNTVNINLETVKRKKIAMLRGQVSYKMKGYTHKLLYGEIASWDIQLEEAKAYKLDNSYPTVFIDTLLENRDIEGETKDVLIDKILTKAETHKRIYSKWLGRFHYYIKLVENSEDPYFIRDVNVEEVLEDIVSGTDHRL